MPEYTLDEIEKAVPDPVKQRLLIGHTVESLRKLKPEPKVPTWIALDEVARIFGDG